MSVFTLACDESWGRPEQGMFYRAGLLAPEEDLADFFMPAWQERVLTGPPSIPFLHMTQIYNSKWAAQHGLGRVTANDRVAAAISVLTQLGSIYLLAARIPAKYAEIAFEEVKVQVSPEVAHRNFHPEYPLFTSFVVAALQVASQLGCTRLDLLIERNADMTDVLKVFHDGMAKSIVGTPNEHLAPLVGSFIPAGKNDPRLQAADLVCWFAQREASGLANEDQQRHIDNLARLQGTKFSWLQDDLDAMRDRAKAASVESGAPGPI